MNRSRPQYYRCLFVDARSDGNDGKEDGNLLSGYFNPRLPTSRISHFASGQTLRSRSGSSLRISGTRGRRYEYGNKRDNAPTTHQPILADNAFTVQNALTLNVTLTAKHNIRAVFGVLPTVVESRESKACPRECEAADAESAKTNRMAEAEAEADAEAEAERMIMIIVAGDDFEENLRRRAFWLGVWSVFGQGGNRQGPS